MSLIHKRNIFQLLNRFFALFKWFVLFGSYGFLIHKLVIFENYNGLKKDFLSFDMTHFSWLFLVLLMMPLNWFFEAYKWRFLCRSFENISFSHSIKSVLAGLTPGFFSPNRVGELIGRSLLLKPENRISGIMMASINSFSQTITVVTCGIPSAVFFFFNTKSFSQESYKCYTYICLIWLIFFLFFYLQLPRFCGWLSKKIVARKIKKQLDIISNMSIRNLVVVLNFSFIRYIVFCFQLYFLLFFCSVSISPIDALIAITINYLFITITPSMAFSEVAIRTSYVVLFVGAFAENKIGIASAGLLLWIINFAVPMLIGSVFFAKARI